VRVFPFGVGRDKLEAAAAEAGLSVGITNQLREATVVLTTKTHYRRGSNLVRIAEASGTPVVVLRKNTQPQVQDFLRTVARERGVEVRAAPPSDEEEMDLSGVMGSAMQEAEEAAQRVLAGEFSVQLMPQSSYVRRLQHLLAERFSLASTSRGREPERAVLFYRA
jgi:hypothetical protein